jgi:hypothetical protein
MQGMDMAGSGGDFGVSEMSLREKGRQVGNEM